MIEIFFLRLEFILSFSIPCWFLQGMKSLPDYIEFKKFPRIPFNEIFTAATDDLLALIESLLDLNPTKRCTATQVGYVMKTCIISQYKH